MGEFGIKEATAFEPAGLFILHELSERDGGSMRIEELAKNMETGGWIALCHLYAAEWVTDNGLSIRLTERGEEMTEVVKAMMAPYS